MMPVILFTCISRTDYAEVSTVKLVFSSSFGYFEANINGSDIKPGDKFVLTKVDSSDEHPQPARK
jgi:hypothetical protein